MQQDPTITTPDNPGSPAASTAQILETLRTCCNIATGMEAGTIMAHEIDWHKLAARCHAAAEALIVPSPVRTDAPLPAVLQPMTGTLEDLEQKLPVHELDVTMDASEKGLALVDAARELARGGEARFAMLSTFGGTWKLRQVVRFRAASYPQSTVPDEIRLNHADGSPFDLIQPESPVALLHTFEPGHRIGSSPTAIARDTGIIATKLQRYLTQYGASYVRLRLDGRRLS